MSKVWVDLMIACKRLKHQTGALERTMPLCPNIVFQLPDEYTKMPQELRDAYKFWPKYSGAASAPIRCPESLLHLIPPSRGENRSEASKAKAISLYYQTEYLDMYGNDVYGSERVELLDWLLEYFTKKATG